MKEVTNNTMEIFHKEAPEVAAAFDGLIQSLINSTGIDEKTKQLIYIAMKASRGDIAAISFHVAMAKKLGATRKEVVDAILMTLAVSGITGVATCLPTAIEIYSNTD